MIRTPVLRKVLRGLSVAWGLAFVGAFVATGAVILATDSTVTTGTVVLTFLLGHLLAGMFAVTGSILASGAQSPNIRKMARVPMAGTGTVALATASLGGFIYVWT